MALKISRIRALCFDIDGTLSDTDDQFVQRLAGWLQPFQHIFSNHNTLPFARRMVMLTESPATFLFGLPDRFGLDKPLASFADFIYWAGLGKSPRPFLLIPGVIEMLTRLHDHYPMCVVSARGQRSAQAFLTQFGLLPYFTAVITGQTCRHTKPYPDPIQYAARCMQVSPAEILMIGDTTVDIQAGKAAGAQTLGVLCGFGQKEELLRAGANQIIANTAQLTQILLETN